MQPGPPNYLLFCYWLVQANAFLFILFVFFTSKDQEIVITSSAALRTRAAHAETKTLS